MTINFNFLLYKLNREIMRSGTTFSFYKIQKNEFNEVIGYSYVGDYKGLYHEQVNTQIKNRADGATYITVKSPLILIPYELFTELNPNVNDKFVINEKEYFFIGGEDLYNKNIAIDVSLENRGD